MGSERRTASDDARVSEREHDAVKVGHMVSTTSRRHGVEPLIDSATTAERAHKLRPTTLSPWRHPHICRCTTLSTDLPRCANSPFCPLLPTTAPVHSSPIVYILEPCTHDVQLHGLCALCGKDLTVYV